MPETQLVSLSSATLFRRRFGYISLEQAVAAGHLTSISAYDLAVVQKFLLTSRLQDLNVHFCFNYYNVKGFHICSVQAGLRE